MKCIEPYKSQLFSTLNDMTLQDMQRLPDGGIGRTGLRILEIGIGSGNNLKYYPNNTRLVAIEPNPHFRTRFDDKLKNYPNVTLEKAVVGTAEDMSSIGDNSVDVVVSTHVLCSVSDPKQCLREIRRVLAPNGKFIYVEHVSYPLGSVDHKIQSWIECLWKLFNDDCRLTQQTSQHIKDTQFSSINEKSVIINDLSIRPIRPHIFGIALK